MSKTASTRKFKVIRSKTGSDVTFPSIMVNGLLKSLTAKWDQDSFLPKEFEDDPYIADAEEKGLVEVKDADKMPTGPKPLPDDLDSLQKGWLTQLLYGLYDERMKSYTKDWANSRFPDKSNKKGRINDLTNHVLPLVIYAIQFEQEMSNRPEVIADMKKVKDFIENEGWNTINK